MLTLTWKLYPDTSNNRDIYTSFYEVYKTYCFHREEEKMSKFSSVDAEVKKIELEFKVKSKLHDAKEWVVRNKELVIFFAPMVITGVTTVAKVVGKNVNLRKEESVKNLYCYDRSLGHYWKLSRELSNKEWVEIDKRKQNGERLADILSDMKVLK